MNSTNSSDALVDSDGDGFNAAREYVAGTAANNGSDYHRLTHVLSSNNAPFVVRFPTKSGRDYQVWYVDTGLKSGSWTLATSNRIAGTGGTMEWVDNGTQTSPHPRNATNRFYRVDVLLPQ